MDISKIGSNVANIANYNSTQNNSEDAAAQSDVIADTYSSKSEENKKIFTYSNTKNMTNAQLWEQFFHYTTNQVTKQIANMQTYIAGFIDGSQGQIDVEELENNLYEKYGISAKLDPANVEEGGIYSPENLSDTLVNFAKALSGGDVSKADMLLEAAKKGFEKAESVWGGELPEICRETYDLMVEKFEAWVSGE